jgi:Zn finger protein HypA/HybF involved in hydrogenase expression
MPRQGRTKLVPPNIEPAKQALETLNEVSLAEQKEEPILTELDNEIECPRCHEYMELQSNFDKLMYNCESCSFLLKCV